MSTQNPPPADYVPLVVNADQFGRGLGPSKSGLRARINRWGEAAVYGPWRTRKRRIVTGIVTASLLLGTGLGVYLATRPMAKPDYDKDRLDRLFKFTLLSDEFNKLPVDERLELMGSLVQRLKNMDGGDSLLLAAFASSVQGKAREQLMENASRLMIDTADMFATEYQDVPEAQKGKFLEEALVRFVELGSALSGEAVTESPQEIVAEAKQNAQQDSERAQQNPLSLRQNMRIMDFANGTVGEHASPQQRGRIAVFMRDMVHHLRGDGGGG